jgi:hypothetical protein
LSSRQTIGKTTTESGVENFSPAGTAELQGCPN